MAAVEQLGGVVSEDALSPLTKPEYEAVMAGTFPPYVVVGEEAVTMRGAAVTPTSPTP